MPGFGVALDDTARWNVIDFIHANADTRRLELANGVDAAVRVPEFSVACPDGSDSSISQMRGRIVHLVFASAQSAARLDQLAALADMAIALRNVRGALIRYHRGLYQRGYWITAIFAADVCRY